MPITVPGASSIASGGVNNYVMTAVDANSVQGESALQFDGTNLGIGPAHTVDQILHIESADPVLKIQDSSSSGDAALAFIEFRDAGDTRRGFIGDASSGNADIYLKADTGKLLLEGSEISLENDPLTNVGASGNDLRATNWTLTGAAQNLEMRVTNTGTGGYAKLVLTQDNTNAAAADPTVQWNINGGDDETWSAGIDNSSSGDKFYIANYSSFGQTGRDVLVLDGRIAGSSAYARMTIANANPVLDNSASANFMMLDIPNSDAQITGQTTITHHQPLGIRIQCQRMSASAAVTVNDASHIQIFGVPSPDTNVTFTNSSGIYIMNSTHGGTVTNQYGIKLDTMTGGGTTNVGIDMGNNTLENVGAAGNDFKAATLDLASSFTIQGAGRLNISSGTSFLAIQSDDGGGVGNKALFGVYGLRMNSNTAHGTTAGTNIISLFNGTAPAGTLANGASFFCASGEMKVIDAAGNITVLSPHDDDGEWVFHSQDDAGKVIHIQMERLMKRLDEMLGGGFIEEYIED